MATQQQPSGGLPDAIAGDTGSDGIDRDGVFDLLSNQHRRYAIHHCKREDDPVELGDLAEHVASWELDKEIAELTSAERKRVCASLQQTHLPIYLGLAGVASAAATICMSSVIGHIAQNNRMQLGKMEKAL